MNNKRALSPPQVEIILLDEEEILLTSMTTINNFEDDWIVLGEE